ncbi:hypothetical protein GOBAR_DD00415 [Gossypium barbadense]|nr:hypothetical protein GOBAR_DD00415 [Gossypium barbadense]
MMLSKEVVAQLLAQLESKIDSSFEWLQSGTQNDLENLNTKATLVLNQMLVRMDELAYDLQVEVLGKFVIFVNTNASTHHLTKSYDNLNALLEINKLFDDLINMVASQDKCCNILVSILEHCIAPRIMFVDNEGSLQH